MATAVRDTNTIIEVLADWDPLVRSTCTIVEVFADWDPFLRATNVVVEVLADWDPLVRVTNTLVEVLADWDPLVRVTQYHLEVIRDSEVEEPPEEEGAFWLAPRRRPPDEIFFRRDLPFIPRRRVLTMPVVTPTDEGAEQWWRDEELGGWWPLAYAIPEFDPTATINVPSRGTTDHSEVLIGCRDGYIRKLDRTAHQDDGVPFTSKCMIGPFLVGDSTLTEGLVEDIEGVLTTVSGDVSWELRVHREWENAAKEATAATYTGTWTTTSANPHVRPRSRGSVFSLLLSNAETDDGWNFEQVVVLTSARGRRRIASNPLIISVAAGQRIITTDGDTVTTSPGQTILPLAGQEVILDDGTTTTTGPGTIIVVPVSPSQPTSPPPASPSVATITPNNATVDNAQALEDLIELYSASGSDLGITPLPAGTIRLVTTPEIHQEVGTILQGQGMTVATGGPRIWSGWTGMLNGTSLYGDPAASGSGAVINVQNTRNLKIKDLDVHLAASVGGNYRPIGILFTNPDQPARGPGEYHLDSVAVVMPNNGTIVSGTIGLKFAQNTSDLNIDTAKIESCEFKGLEKCIQINHTQGLVWRANNISIRQCSTFAEYNAGGNFHLSQWHWADTVSSNPITIVRVGSGVTGGQAPEYSVTEGYIDRQASQQTVTIFDLKDCTTHVVATSMSNNFRNLNGTADYTSSGAPYFDLGSRNTVISMGDQLRDQPIVRWNSASQAAFKGHCTVIAARISHIGTVSVPREIVTSTGGYNGHLTLVNCMAGMGITAEETISATVGIYPVAGDRHTHFDYQASSQKTYDGIDNLQTFANSWIEDQFAPAGHWKMDEAVGATTLSDSTTGGNDLTVDSDMQVTGSPVPWLEQCCDFEQSTADNGRDTGISVTPGSDDLLITGFFKQGTVAAGPVAAVATSTRFALFRFTGSAGVFQHGRIGSLYTGDTVPTVGNWVHFLAYINTSADTLYVCLDGKLVQTKTSAGFNGLAGSGNVWIGGDSSGNGRFSGSLSRVTVAKPSATLTAEDMDKIFRSATFFRERRGQVRPT